jgi:hypothetical protein
MHLLNNVPATSAQDSELIDCLHARVVELRPDLDVENVAETLKYCLTIGYSVFSSLRALGNNYEVVYEGESIPRLHKLEVRRYMAGERAPVGSWAVLQDFRQKS